tara:strand:+ start:1005 stop:1196 length:192 start_codon:yes stop_codon:yes gene_type:complete
MKNKDEFQARKVQEWLEKCPFDITYSKNILTKESTRYTIMFDIPNGEYDWEGTYEDEQPSDVY